MSGKIILTKIGVKKKGGFEDYRKVKEGRSDFVRDIVQI